MIFCLNQMPVPMKRITGACQSGKSTQLEGQRGGGDKDVVISQSAKDLIRLLENRPSSAKITLKSENHEKVYDNPFDPNIELSDPKLPDDYFEAVKHLIDIADGYPAVRPKSATLPVRPKLSKRMEELSKPTQAKSLVEPASGKAGKINAGDSNYIDRGEAFGNVKTEKGDRKIQKRIFRNRDLEAVVNVL